jgi:hypothetical protein
VASGDIGVRGQWRQAAFGRAVASFALLAALAGCAAGDGPGASTPAASTGARVGMSPVSATHAASATASNKPTSNPAKSPTLTTTPTPAKPSALPVAPGDAGGLPQTNALPKASGTAFDNAVHDIWLAVTTGNPDYALPAFFPEDAYGQVKAIADPDSDWRGRLWYDFTLDLAAVRKLIKPGATLTRVIVPAQYAQWIPVGACYNNVGYWHVPGSRVVYRQGGVTNSFGIASFISWRGDWYLIHFGAVVRNGAYGIVDDPETGPGTPGPPGNC